MQTGGIEMRGENVATDAATSAGNHLRVIAIDGPAAAGKTTVALLLARRVGAIFLDTGALYRAVTLAASDRGISPSDQAALVRLCTEIDLAVAPASVNDGRAHDVLIDGVDVTGRLRTAEIDATVSEVSAHQGVRDALLPIQRRIADGGAVVIVGRDIATTVVPDAGTKIYLDASARERAKRRYDELIGKGVAASYDAVLADLERRDLVDSTRDIAPLQRDAGALVVNTDGLTIDQVVDRIEAIVRANWANAE
jgi:cytidylate kinase